MGCALRFALISEQKFFLPSSSHFCNGSWGSRKIERLIKIGRLFQRQQFPHFSPFSLVRGASLVKLPSTQSKLYMNSKERKTCRGLQATYRHTVGKLQACYRLIIGMLQVCCRNIGVLQGNYMHIVGKLQTHCRQIVAILQANCRSILSKLQTYCSHI